MTGIEPVTTCLGNKYSVHLSYILIGSLDGSCTRFFLAENQSDFSIRPQGCTGMMGFEPMIARQVSAFNRAKLNPQRWRFSFQGSEGLLQRLCEEL